MEAFGTSKSRVGHRPIHQMEAKLQEHLSRRFDHFMLRQALRRDLGFEDATTDPACVAE